MKRLIWQGLAVFALLGSAFSAGYAQPAGRYKEGTLANQKLVADALQGFHAAVAVRGCRQVTKVTPYVDTGKLPSGPVGARVWNERWVADGCGKNYPIDLTFFEMGSDASWSINMPLKRKAR